MGDQNSEAEEPKPEETPTEETTENIEKELQDYPNQDALEQNEEEEPLEDNTGVKPEMAEGHLSQVESEKESEEKVTQDVEKKTEILDENNPYCTKLFKLKTEFRHFILE